MRPRLALLLPLAAFAVGLLIFGTVNGSGQPTHPEKAKGSPSLPQLRAGAPASERIAALEPPVEAGAGGAAALIDLGDAYLQRARETANPADYARAEKLFTDARDKRPRDAGPVIGPARWRLPATTSGPRWISGGRPVGSTPSPSAPIPCSWTPSWSSGAMRPLPARCSDSSTSSPTSPHTLVSPTFASCTATSPAPCRPCAWPSRPAEGLPNRSPTCRPCWVTSSVAAAVAVRPKRPIAARSHRFGPTCRRWPGWRAWMRSAGAYAGPPEASRGSPAGSRCRST